MAVYAIGDVQACYDELQNLLAQLQFNPDQDQLWFVGDLVNRGPNSLAVLRFVKDLGSKAVTVLGNHDLHLLAVSLGVRERKRSDTFDAILEAPDCAELLEWLRCRPLLHHDSQLSYTMVHAGLPPQWDLTLAQACAAEVEAALQGPKYREFIEHMYGDRPAVWSAGLAGWERLRFMTNCFTRLRYCNLDGSLALDEKGAPGSHAENLLPWFEITDRASQTMNIIFGHWSTLGRYSQLGVQALDTGCVWGGDLTALRIDVDPVEWSCVQCQPHCLTIGQ